MGFRKEEAEIEVIVERQVSLGDVESFALTPITVESGVWFLILLSVFKLNWSRP
jgi:hypothetical protein